LFASCYWVPVIQFPVLQRIRGHVVQFSNYSLVMTVRIGDVPFIVKTLDGLAELNVAGWG